LSVTSAWLLSAGSVGFILPLVLEKTFGDK